MKILLKTIHLLCVAIFFTIALHAQSSNVFLQTDFWRAQPTIDDIKQKIEEGNDPLEFNDRKFNGVVNAINNGASLESVKYLIELEGHDLSELTHDGRTYIHWAALRGRTDLVKYLMSQDIKRDVVDDHGYSVLNFAANGGRTEKDLYEFLLANGSSVLEENHHGASTILLLAPTLENFEMVDYLIAKGASLDAKDEDGSGLFYYIARGGNLTMMDILIEKGLDYKGSNDLGANAMIAAALGGRRANGLQVFQYLEDKGVQVNVTTSDGTTPLTAIAGRTGDPEVIKYFIAKGVDINQADKQGSTPLMMAASSGDLKIVELIESKSNTLNDVNGQGQSALTKAVESNQATVVKYLIDKGAKSDIVDTEGNSLAYYLVQSYNPRNVEDFEAKIEILKAEGIDFGLKQAKGNTLLHLAAEENNQYLIEKMLALGVDVNTANEEGTTPLQIAAMKADDVNILKILLAADADKNVKTVFDESVYDLASENELLSANNINIEFLKL